MRLVRCLALTAVLIGFLSSGAMSEARAESRQPLTSAQIKQVMAKHAPKVRACYMEHAMNKEESLGKLTLELLVRAGGRVAAVEVEAPSAQGKELEKCVGRLAKRWRFPKSSYQTLVKYPMMFVHTQAQGAGPVVPGENSAR